MTESAYGPPFQEQTSVRTTRDQVLLSALTRPNVCHRLGKAGGSHLGSICDIKLVPDEFSTRATPPLISCDGTGEIRVWDMASPQSVPLALLSNARQYSVSFFILFIIYDMI